jgi:hypothetical protein
MGQAPSIAEVVAGLPPDCQQQVREFVEALIAKRHPGQRRPPKFDWAGCLTELRDRYTSVDLQHQIGRWRV